MNRTIIVICIGLLAVALAAAGCMNGASSPPDAAATLNAFYTSQAQTLQAALTPITATSTPFLLTPPTPIPGGPSLTPLPTFTLPPPAVTATATLPPPIVTATATLQSNCDRVQFVADVTVPDGTHFPPGTAFTKTWRLKNAGTCTWTTAYTLAFVSGNRMGGPTSQPLTTTVAPGQTFDLSVRLVSPSAEGSYTGNWMLRNPSGANFGVGDTASSPFWVKIVVEQGTTIYNFAKSACSAAWTSGAGDLPCPGTSGDADGFVLIQQHPVREDGVTENETGILTVPQKVRDGYIKGKFPLMTIVRGDRFRSVVDCHYQYDSCNVIFRLDYKIEGQDDTRTLWHSNEAYEGRFFTVDLDLSSLAGKKVRFFLIVQANGSPNEDYAQWIAPRIVRLSSLVTPTSRPRPTRTPTRTPTPKPGHSTPAP